MVITDRKRNLAIDLLKGSLIFLVVWMHVLQHSFRGINNYGFAVLVYSFHMPAFCIISGYLFSRSLCRQFRLVVAKQFKRLILPNLSWGGISFIICWVMSGHVGLSDIVHIPFFCWYLASLFISSVSFYIINKFTNNIGISSILLVAISLFIPGAEFLKFMIPFFCIGVLFSLNDVFVKIGTAKWTIILGLICIVLAPFWKYDYTIYVSMSPTIYSFIDLGIIKAYVFRLIYGFIFSTFLISLFQTVERLIYPCHALLKLSKDSMGLYVIQSFIILTFSPLFNRITLGCIFLDYFVSLLISIAFVVLISLFLRAIRNNKTLSLVLLGEF